MRQNRTAEVFNRIDRIAAVSYTHLDVYKRQTQSAAAPKVSKGRSESPLVASAEAKPPAKQKKESKTLSLACHKESVSCERFRPPAGGRGTFPHGKVPKGCRGRPKGACLVAAPGPPVAKQQCTASLAGARPAGFTSVPGRATVAFKVDRKSVV